MSKNNTKNFPRAGSRAVGTRKSILIDADYQASKLKNCTKRLRQSDRPRSGLRKTLSWQLIEWENFPTRAEINFQETLPRTRFHREVPEKNEKIARDFLHFQLFPVIMRLAVRRSLKCSQRRGRDEKKSSAAETVPKMS